MEARTCAGFQASPALVLAYPQDKSDPVTDNANQKRSESNSSVSRRRFGKVAAATFGAASGFHFFPALADKKLEKPALAAIGAGGKGAADISGSKSAGFEIVALVDIVDGKKLCNFSGDKKALGRIKNIGKSRESYPDAAFYTDYREMLSDLGDKIDAVTVSTPDHHHFHASVMAMQSGKHVYCQKPLTHGIWEARMLNEVAAKTGVKTQMGNQAHANDHMRRCVELIRAGVIGKVTEIHAWTNRPIWPQGFKSPPASRAGARGYRLETVDRPGTLGRLQFQNCSLFLARLVELWDRRTGRHGVSHHGSRLLVDGSGRTRQL